MPSIHPANIEMVTTPFEQDFLRSVERIPGVAQAEGRQSLSVRASKDGVSWLSLNLLAAEDAGATQINQLKPVAGATIPGEHELLIGYEQMRDTGFRTGDWLQVQLPDGTLRSDARGRRGGRPDLRPRPDGRSSVAISRKIRWPGWADRGYTTACWSR